MAQQNFQLSMTPINPPTYIDQVGNVLARRMQPAELGADAALLGVSVACIALILSAPALYRSTCRGIEWAITYFSSERAEITLITPDQLRRTDSPAG